MGGAGFIGSHIAARFLRYGDEVTVIDGLLPRTGGRKNNLIPILDRIKFLDRPIEEIDHLSELLSSCDLLIDCMAWTSHQLALEDPLYDLRLNAASHLYMLKALPKFSSKKIIYLGSTSQFGRQVGVVHDSTCQSPVDIQGIHKMAAEYYFRVYSTITKHRMLCLRLSHCFGENQPMSAGDIGLVGGFIRDFLQGKIVKVYGDPAHRYRHFLYVRDVAEYVIQLSQREFGEFEAYNIVGETVSIAYLLELLQDVIRGGRIQYLMMPDLIQSIETNHLDFDNEKVKSILKDCPVTPFETAIRLTVHYFQEYMHDLPL